MLFQVVDDILDGDGYVADREARRRRASAPTAPASGRSAMLLEIPADTSVLSRDRQRARRPHASSRDVKKRLDVLLVERGLAESRAQAQALVLAGSCRATRRPASRWTRRPSSRSTAPARYVSRGGEKLANALDAFGVDPAGLDCLDVGASTGGFTDVLLQRGAARVIALDVGYGQLHPRLRDDPRVTVLERTNARELTRAAVRAASSSSATSRSSPCARRCRRRSRSPRPGWQALVLVKPQFEAGRGEVGKGGVVRDTRRARECLREVAEAALALGCRDGPAS